MTAQIQTLAIDPGFGSFKYATSTGTAGEVVAHVAPVLNVDKRVNFASVGMGVEAKAGPRPLLIRNGIGDFYVGLGAKDRGQLIENNDLDKLLDSPEARALFYAAMTKAQAVGKFDVLTALPLALVMGADAKRNVEQVKAWMGGAHEWEADNHPRVAHVRGVKTLSQAQAILFDYALAMNGTEANSIAGEIGVISIGHNTIELLVFDSGRPVEAFAASEQKGVRVVLELLAEHMGADSVGVVDAWIREKRPEALVQLRAVLPAWHSQIKGLIDRKWRNVKDRLRVVVVAGGGVLPEFAGPVMRGMFVNRLHVVHNPTGAVADGLMKLAARQAKGA